jgi:hypothetical protein
MSVAPHPIRIRSDPSNTGLAHSQEVASLSWVKLERDDLFLSADQVAADEHEAKSRGLLQHLHTA